MTPRVATAAAAPLAALLAGVLLLAGCGGDDSPRTTATASATTASATASAAPSGSVTTSAAPSAPATAAAPTVGATTPGSTTPGSDDVDVDVPVGTASQAPPVGFGQSSATSAGTVRVTRTEAVTGEADGPGQVAGPAVRLTVAVTNTGSGALPLTGVTVDLRDAAGAPATALSGPGARAFTGSLAPGATADAVYVFALATADRAGATLLVGLTAGAPVVVVTGDLPR